MYTGLFQGSAGRHRRKQKMFTRMVQKHDTAAAAAAAGGGTAGGGEDPGHATFGTSWLTPAEARVLEDERSTPYTQAAKSLVNAMRTNVQLNEGVLDRAADMRDDFRKMRVE